MAERGQFFSRAESSFLIFLRESLNNTMGHYIEVFNCPSVAHRMYFVVFHVYLSTTCIQRRSLSKSDYIFLKCIFKKCVRLKG